MLPDSYNKVSQETKMMVQSFVAHVHGMSQNIKGSDYEARAAISHCQTYAVKAATQWAINDWYESRKPCSAELFVQRFVQIMWGNLGHDYDRPFPYDLPEPAALAAGPLSTEFLRAIGTTEEEVLGMIKKETSSEEDTQLALHTIPAFVKTETSPLGTANAWRGPTNPPAQRVKAEPQSPDSTSILGKRKNDEPEATERKYGRGNDGQRVPPGPRDTNRTQEQWGAPLSAKDHQLMNIGLMTDIWTNRISPRHMSDYGGGLFEVRIPSEKAWTLLGKDIRRVFKLISSEWRPIRLHTRESGAFMCVGLWIKTGQTQGQKAEVMRHTMPELYRLLRRWSLQAQGDGQAESLADFLTDYLGA